MNKQKKKLVQLTEELQSVAINFFRNNYGDKIVYTLRDGGTQFTGNQIADEIEQCTQNGNNWMESFLKLSIDLVARGKKELLNNEKQ